MGLLLFDAFEEAAPDPEPEAEFVRAGEGRTISHVFGGAPKAFAPKDPAETDWLNFDFSASLARLSTALVSWTVFVSAGNSSLLVDLAAHSAGVVSCRWRGGRYGADYAITCRVETADGRRWDLTGTVTVLNS